MWSLTSIINRGFCMLRCHDEQNNEIKSRTRGNEAIKRCGKPKMYDAAARHEILPHMKATESLGNRNFWAAITSEVAVDQNVIM